MAHVISEIRVGFCAARVATIGATVVAEQAWSTLDGYVPTVSDMCGVEKGTGAAIEFGNGLEARGTFDCVEFSGEGDLIVVRFILGLRRVQPSCRAGLIVARSGTITTVRGVSSLRGGRTRPRGSLHLDRDQLLAG